MVAQALMEMNLGFASFGISDLVSVSVVGASSRLPLFCDRRAHRETLRVGVAPCWLPNAWERRRAYRNRWPTI